MSGNIIVSLLSAFDDKGIRDAEKALGALSGKVKSIGKSMAVGLGSYFIGANAVQFVKQSVDAAMQLERNMAGVKTIFGESTAAMMDFINASEQLGMSHADAARAVTFLGSVFKQTGMPMKQVIDQTKTMVSLGTDLAATYGYSVDEALTAMTATFRGEYDPIEKFGVAMKQSQVNTELHARGLDKLKGAALTAAQQQIRYEMILQRTADAQGAFKRNSDGLFQSQSRLKAAFTDMQAALGANLTPALSHLAQAMTPIVTSLAPKLSAVFKAIGEILVEITPLLPVLADGIVQAFGFMAAVIQMTHEPLTNFLTNMLKAIPAALTFMAVFKGSQWLLVFTQLIQGLRVQYALLKMELREATIAQVLFNGASAATPWGAIAAGVALIATAWVALAQGVDNYNKSVAGIAGLSAKAQAQAQAYAEKQAKAAMNSSYLPGSVDKQAAYEQAKKKALVDWYARYQAKSNKTAQDKMILDWKAIQAQIDKMFGGDGTSTSKIKPWFDTFAIEIAKQTKRLELKKLGLSDALIDSMLNAQDWKVAVAKVLGMTTNQIKAFKAQWLATAAGASEAEKILAENSQKFVDAVKKRVETIKSLTKDLASFMPKTLAEITADTGQFESAVVSAADTLRSSLKDALDNKGITQEAYGRLLTYANQEISIMQKVAAARDRLVRKIEAAKATYLEVANAVRSYGNITSASTSQVTESYKKIIDGVEVTVTRTVDALNSKDLVANYKAIVDKTKAFLTNLTQLKKMGLNQTLFKQIIDAGVDAGNATAEAIVNGGGDTVASLNDLFGQLDDTGAKLGDLTAQVMQDSGIKIVSGFIDGLMEQEKNLSTAAELMAKAFSDAFNNNVRFVIPMINPSAYGLTSSQANAALVAAGLPTDQGGAGKDDFKTTVADVVKDVVPEVVQTLVQQVPEVFAPSIPTPVLPPEVAVVVSKVADGADRVERAGAGVGDLANKVTVVLDTFKDRVERAGEGIGALATVNTSGLTQTNTGAVDTTTAAGLAKLMAGSGSTYNVTVNAGMGTDGAAVGQTIVQLLKQYERNNGPVWTAA